MEAVFLKLRNYKKTAFWAVTVVVIAGIVLAGCSLTEPKENPESVPAEDQSYAVVDGTVESDPRGEMPLEFMFASGAGGWSTSLVLNPDGSFEGVYHDSEMGENGPEYPYGSVYISHFSGRFSEMTQIGPDAWSMRLLEVTTQDEVGKEWIEEQVRYIASEPFGIACGEEFILYLPGASTEGMDECFLSWRPIGKALDKLEGYGLYNVNTGDGLFTEWLS